MSSDDLSAEQGSTHGKLALGIGLIAGIVAAALRVVPHPPNCSGVGALGLFGGARLRGWQAYWLPIGIMVASDLLLWTLLGFDYKYSLAHPSRLYVYSSFMIYVLIGRWLHTKNSLSSIALASAIGALQFFLVTNFCEWLFQPWMPYYDQIEPAFRYARDWSGLAACFTLALPFYQADLPYTAHPFMMFTDFRLSLMWTFVGDFVFTAIYLGVFAKAEKYALPLKANAAPY